MDTTAMTHAARRRRRCHASSLAARLTCGELPGIFRSVVAICRPLLLYFPGLGLRLHRKESVIGELVGIAPLLMERLDFNSRQLRQPESLSTSSERDRCIMHFT